MSAYLIVKFFHVFFAITAVGANLTYGVWFTRAAAKGAIDDDASKALAARGQFLAGLMGVLVLGILVLMVFKPA